MWSVGLRSIPARSFPMATVLPGRHVRFAFLPPACRLAPRLAPVSADVEARKRRARCGACYDSRVVIRLSCSSSRNRRRAPVPQPHGRTCGLRPQFLYWLRSTCPSSAASLPVGRSVAVLQPRRRRIDFLIDLEIFAVSSRPPLVPVHELAPALARGQHRVAVVRMEPRRSPWASTVPDGGQAAASGCAVGASSVHPYGLCSVGAVVLASLRSPIRPFHCVYLNPRRRSRAVRSSRAYRPTELRRLMEEHMYRARLAICRSGKSPSVAVFTRLSDTLRCQVVRPTC